MEGPTLAGIAACAICLAAAFRSSRHRGNIRSGLRYLVALSAIAAASGLALFWRTSASSDDNAAAREWCTDYKMFRNGGNGVRDRSHWEALVNRAAALKYEPLHAAGVAAKTELPRLDENPGADPSQVGQQEPFTDMTEPCVDLGVSPFLGD